MQKSILVILFLFTFAAAGLKAQIVSDYAVQLSAKVQKAPAQIQLNWKANTSSTGYLVYRKAKNAAKWGNALASLPGTTTNWTDNNVTAGVPYEYYVRRQGSNYLSHGYILAGIEVTAKEDAGTVILLVDDTFSLPLANELKRLENDLQMEGWKVIRHNVKRTEAVTAIKTLVKTDYAANPTQVKTVFLIGHVPVPYSGFYAIDGHNDHQGAWPADAYYGDMDGVWLDEEPTTVTNSARSENHNIPGDGKFDHDIIPSPIDLEVGRVDMFNLPAFNHSEIELMRRYLNKDHAFRNKLFTAKNQSLIDDNFGAMGGEAFAAAAYKSFTPMFGDTNVIAGDYRTLLKNDSYIWSYGGGAGTYTSSSGITNSDTFVTDSLKTVFTMLFGSYFGDWDSKNNLLRAALASKGFTLTSCWSGRPQWILHHMALGENIGYSTRISQSDTSLYFRHPVFELGAFRQTALLGDPTLRLNIVAPPKNFSLSHIKDSSQVMLQWQQPQENNIKGYYIYRTNNLNIPFSRIDSVGATSITYLDSTPSVGMNYYKIRAIKLEETASGSYYNLSPTVLDSAFAKKATGIHYAENFSKNVKIYPNPGNDIFNIELPDADFSKTIVSVRDVLGKLITEQNYFNLQNNIIKLDLGQQPKGIYFITIKTPDAYVTRKLIKNK